MSFKKNVQNFTCENCTLHVQGNGYTNHCPQCLFSKHVDIQPGDRKAQCKGLMRPTQVVAKGDSYILIHTCTRCGHTKKNKMADSDTMETAVAIVQNRAHTSQ